VTQEAYQHVTGNNPSHFKGAKLPVETVNWNEAQNYCRAVGMELPTEAQWEYAARAGSNEARYGPLDAIAWYSGNSGGTTHPVGLKRPNAWSLYDMLGNVWQWTASDYNSTTKTLRGGSWNYDPGYNRVSYRNFNGPAVRYDVIGFRCVGN
jgi:formylglycine-generating enzyme required for sulfatase activity